MTCICGKYDQCKQAKDYVPTNPASPTHCPNCGACAYSNMNCIPTSVDYLLCIHCKTEKAFKPRITGHRATAIIADDPYAPSEPKPRPRIADDVEAIRAAAAARGIRI